MLVDVVMWLPLYTLTPALSLRERGVGFRPCAGSLLEGDGSFTPYALTPALSLGRGGS